MSDAGFYKVKDVANVLRVTVKTVRNYIERGQLIAVKVGGRYLISSNAVKDFINANNK